MPESPARPLGVALIGYAFMGRAHSQAWRTVGAAFDVPPIARRVIVGRDEQAVAEAARRLDWEEHATDWREAITRDDVDIVDICTPGFLHAEIAITALEAGKHVLCEKPLANDPAEAERMVEAARAARERGQVAALGHTYRRVPALAHARDLVAAGRLGQIRQIRASYLQDWLVDAEAGMTWRLREETAGSGALGDIGSHAIDQIQYVTGQQVTAVRGRLATMVPERPGPDGPEPVTVDDAAWATLELDGGAIASVEASRMATGAKNELSVEVYGTKGALRFDLERLDELWFLDATAPVAEQGFTRVLVTEPEHPYLEGWWPQGHILGWENAFTNQARDLLRAVRDRDPAAYSPDFEDGLTLQRILDAVIASHRADGATVRL
ncbi:MULTISPECIES: Gfo/Idh/MocA family protein [Brachybacterium]|uniref:Gfo/Idh/MocA family oxidoreductase n=2 Tax=Brachybacterium TaxID=43668 RepID=A0A426SND3_9MICO|nr:MULTISPECIES: Gfo/Idh/MocA family oxidoreductase [Brachybacterium]MCT1437295.1 Gfo/Idh/MocA family oxidoreductase [Brachybacterium paraconglomeratum]RRR19745.1 gfo/Idh/MocA family oxidoreductase [Brachybacterium paraconglomeratum]GLI31435.1 dehydrogenase [Brachybacterium conglomeratum]GLK04347.1 dehydrogenase [Brachybacterium conglomeratum]